MSQMAQIEELLANPRIRNRPHSVPRNGFPNRTEATLSVDGSGVFTIAPVGTTFSFYSNGKLFKKNAAAAVNVTVDQTLHFIYYSTAGVLTISTSPWNITSDNVPVATVFKDGSDYVLGEERHGADRNRNWHEWAHDTIGCRYESGFGATFGNTTFSIDQGAVADEDLEIDTGGAKTNCRQWYRNAALTSMRTLANKTTPWISNAGAPQYDNAGTLANVSANRFFCSYFYGSLDATYPIYLVTGQAQHANIAAARAETLPAILLSTAEWKLLYKVIYKESGGSAVWQETADFRNVSSGPAQTYTPTTHASLTGRDAAGSHPAAVITVTPAGAIASTDVQAALEEIAAEGHAEFTAENKSGGTITAGQPCAMHVSGTGVVLAGAASAGRLVTGLAAETFLNTVSGRVYTEGILALADWTAAIGSVNLTPGAEYWLSTTDGQLTSTAPTTAAEKVQRVGRALNQTMMDLQIGESILL